MTIWRHEPLDQLIFGQEDQARRGRAAWAAFPADRQPRPVVLLGLAVRPGAFPEGQKMAFLRGAIESVPERQRSKPTAAR